MINSSCNQASSNINYETSSKSITIFTEHLVPLDTELWTGESSIYLCLSKYKNIKNTLDFESFKASHKIHI